MVTGYREKPTLDYDVSMGIYVYDARVLEYLPDGPCSVPRARPAAARRRRARGRLPVRRRLVRPRDDERVRARRGGARAPRRHAGVRRALITGITGQDGSYLADLLLERGYEVHGLVRRPEAPAERIAHVRDRLTLHAGDLLDQQSLEDALVASRADEVYNLAAASSVAASWKDPAATGETTGLGVARLLEAWRRARPRGPALPGLVERDLQRQRLGGRVDARRRRAPRTAPRRPTRTTWCSPTGRRTASFCASGILFNARERAPRRAVRHAQDQLRRGRDQARSGRASCGSAPSSRSATGATRPTSSRRCG